MREVSGCRLLLDLLVADPLGAPRVGGNGHEEGRIVVMVVVAILGFGLVSAAFFPDDGLRRGFLRMVRLR